MALTNHILLAEKIGALFCAWMTKCSEPQRHIPAPFIIPHTGVTYAVVSPSQVRTQIHTVTRESDRKVTVTLKSSCLNLFDHSKGNLWTFDLAGRLVGMYVDHVNYRRTLDNRFFAKSREMIGTEAFRIVEGVSQDVAGELVDRARFLLKKVMTRLPGEFQSCVQRIVATDMITLGKSAEEFLKIYLPISVLPPDQYLSLVLQITEGCSYNQCLFCNFYRDRPFRIKSLEEVSLYARRVREFFGEGLKLRKSIFLADANALVIPQARLVPIMETVAEAFPEFRNIYSFIDVFTGTRKSIRDFAVLRELGLKRVYLGVESGNPGLLDLLQKPQLVSDVIELAKRIKAGGINLGLIFLAGAGGMSLHSRHVNDSVNLIKKMPLKPGDMVYVSEFCETDDEYRRVLGTRGLTAPSRVEIRNMANEFKTALRDVVPKGVAVPIYDIQQFFY